jgi:hypothetical protein
MQRMCAVVSCLKPGAACSVVCFFVLAPLASCLFPSASFWHILGLICREKTPGWPSFCLLLTQARAAQTCRGPITGPLMHETLSY